MDKNSSRHSNLSPEYVEMPRGTQNDPPPSYTDVYPDLTLETGSTPLDKSYSSGDDSVLDEALEFTKNRPKQHTTYQRLRLPVVIPQVGTGSGMPFARGYSSYLQDKGVSITDFVAFIDNYNIASGGDPPFMILDLAGGIVGFVPMGHAQLISGAISGASKLGQAAWGAVKKNRATKFIETANQDFFNPVGLKVEIGSSEAVKVKLGMPADASLVAAYEDSDGLSVYERRMASLKGFAAPVTFNVPPPNDQTTALKKMAAAQQKRALAKQEKKALEDRDKYADKMKDADQKIREKGTDVDKKVLELERKRQKVEGKRAEEIAKVQKEFEKDRRDKPDEVEKIEKKRAKEMKKIDEDFEKEMRKFEKERVKLGQEYDKEARKETDDAKKDDKEVKASQKILWMLVEDL